MRESNNYLFVAADILPNNDRPATVLTNIGIGLADRVTTIGHRFPVFVPVTFDISATGNHTGWAWTGGAMVSIPFKQHWHLLPTVRILHSDLGGGAIQPIFTIMVGWEQ